MEIKSSSDLTKYLLDLIPKIGTEVDHKVANAQANLAGKVISMAKLELAYRDKRLESKKKSIKFLETTEKE